VTVSISHVCPSWFGVVAFLLLFEQPHDVLLNAAALQLHQSLATIQFASFFPYVYLAYFSYNYWKKFQLHTLSPVKVVQHSLYNFILLFIVQFQHSSVHNLCLFILFYTCGLAAHSS
jgi:hypothetical protein